MRIFKNKFSNTEFKTYYIQDDKEVSKLPVTANKLYGLDIETAKKPEFKPHDQAGLCPHLSNIRLIQIYDEDKKVVYVFDLFHINIALLQDFLHDNRFVAHNGIFELKHLINLGFENLNIGCSMLLSQLVDGAEHSPYDPDEEEDEDDQDQTGLAKYKKRYHGLDAVVQRLFGVKVHKEEQTSDWGKPILDVGQITYAALDAVLTYKCATVLSKKLVEYKMVPAYQIVKDTQHVIAKMELSGLPVDWEYHQQMIASWIKKKDDSLAACKPFFGETNMRSGKQMTVWLLEYLKNDPVRLAGWPRTKKKAYAFGKNAIGSFKALPAIAALLEYKKWAKLIDTYGDSLIQKKHPTTERIHTSYILGETLTGRLSSRNPNCQNYPREVEFRNMFRAPDGYVLVVSDFSQIELRLQAEFSQDPMMCAVYKEGRDIYRAMASIIYRVPEDKISKEQRYIAKQVMLALGYGMGPTKFETYCTNASVPPQRPDFYVKAHQTYHSTFNVYSRWCNKVRDRATKLGYIETLLGKRRRLVEDELYTKAPNHVIQGTAAELMERALLICQANLDPKYGEIVATVHDEILLLVSKKIADKAVCVLADAMNQAMKEMFPRAVCHEVAEAAFALRWGEAKAEL